MGNFAERQAQALEACDRVINGIEDESIKTYSALIQCMKIARLVNDQDGQNWLKYEYDGYPTDKSGHITQEGWNLCVRHGRSFVSSKDKETYVFIELAAELEEAIENTRIAIKNYTTQGFSVSGEHAFLATERMNADVHKNTNELLSNNRKNERRLSILKSQYYNYALRWKIDLQFGKSAKRIFDEYQERVSLYFSRLKIETLRKLNAIEDLMEDGNPERYSQVITSCRRLWCDVAKQLFYYVLPEYKERFFKTKSGAEIDISGDHYNNQLSAVIETLHERAARNTLVGSEIIYLVDWMEQINKLHNSGVHAEMTREQAMRCIIHTYIALGDLLGFVIECLENNNKMY